MLNCQMNFHRRVTVFVISGILLLTYLVYSAFNSAPEGVHMRTPRALDIYFEKPQIEQKEESSLFPFSNSATRTQTDEVNDDGS